MANGPRTNKRGEVLAVAKMYDKEKTTPNQTEEKGDGSFCIHDLMEGLPHFKSTEKPLNNQWQNLYGVVAALINNGSLIRLTNSYVCKSLGKRHGHFRYNNPFKREPIAFVKNLPVRETLEALPPEVTEPKAQKINIGPDTIREINISITNNEIKLNIKKN